MANVSILSAEAKVVLKKVLAKSFYSKDNGKALITFLYGKRADAKADVLDALLDFTPKWIGDVSEKLTCEDVDVLMNEYSEVVKYCYGLLSDSDEFGMAMTINKENAQNLLPSSLVELCSEILDLKAGARVLLPYSGDMQLAHQNAQCVFDGFECHRETWAFSQILSQAYGVTSNVICSAEIPAIAEGMKYDCIFSVPPISTFKEHRKMAQSFKNMIENNLSDGGVIACVFPLSFTYTGDWHELRSFITENAPDYSAALLALPAMLSPITSIPLCFFILQKNHKGNVVLMDARSPEFFAKNDGYHSYKYTLKVKSVLETLQLGDQNHVWFGTPEQLRGDVSLMPGHYLADRYAPVAKDGERVLPLSELVDIVSCKHAERGDKARFVGVKRLNENYLNCKICFSQVVEEQDKIGKVLNTEALLAFYMSGMFKLARIVEMPIGSKLVLQNDIVPFKVKSNLVNEDFLLRSLTLEDTIKQANAMATGSVISRLTASDFLKIKIAVPNLDVQTELCKQDAEAKMSDSEKQLKRTFDEYTKDMHMKKHAIGQTIYNLNNWWEVLQKARKEGNGVLDDNTTVGRAKPIKISEVYTNLENAVKKLQQQIGKFDRGNGLEVKNFALTTFVEEYIATHQSPRFTFKYDEAEHHCNQTVPTVYGDEEKGGMMVDYDSPAISCGDPIEYVVFAPDALTIVFDNIISNACAHGFTDRDADNVVFIDIKHVADKYVVEIANNGIPMDTRLSEDDVFTYGKSSKSGEAHCGIGGYEVNKLMHQFNGSAELVLTPEEEFTVCYRLTFNDTNIVSFL